MEKESKNSSEKDPRIGYLQGIFPDKDPDLLEQIGDMYLRHDTERSRTQFIVSKNLTRIEQNKIRKLTPDDYKSRTSEEKRSIAAIKGANTRRLNQIFQEAQEGNDRNQKILKDLRTGLENSQLSKQNSEDCPPFVLKRMRQKNVNDE